MPKGPLLDLLKESRAMYDGWVDEVEAGAEAAIQGGEVKSRSTGGKSYAVPTSDGHILVGGTFEPGKSDGDVTWSALESIFSTAQRGSHPREAAHRGRIRRPASHLSRYDNVYVAGGYSRAGSSGI